VVVARRGTSSSNVTLSANYTNTLASSVAARLLIVLQDSGGEQVASEYVGDNASGGANFDVSLMIGSFPPGSYILSFYVIDSTGHQISQTSALSFTIT
jgi:hypothetical protein